MPRNAWRSWRTASSAVNPDRADAAPGSDVELEVHDVPVLHQVFLALLPQLPGLLRPAFTPQRDEVVIGDRLGTDEAVLHVGVNFTCCLRGLGTLVNGPCAGLLGPHGEESQQVEQLVAGAND